MDKIDKICDKLGELGEMIFSLKNTGYNSGNITKHPGTKHERLTELRKHLALTQNEMAEAVGVSQVAIQKAESGKSFLKIDNLQILVDLYGVNLNWLVSGEGETFLNSKAA